MSDAKNAKNEKNIEVKIKNVRLSFADLFEAQPQKNEAGEITGWYYKSNFLIPKGTEEGKATATAIQDAMKRVRDAMWPPTSDGPKKIKPERRCLRDGDEEDWDGYAGHYYLSGNRKVKGKEAPNPMALIGPRKVKDQATGEMKFPRVKDSDGLLYSGCYVNAVVRVYALNGKGEYPDRINCSIEGIQFLRHGDAFGAKPIDAESAFDDEGPEAESAFDGGSDGKSGGGDDDLL